MRLFAAVNFEEHIPDVIHAWQEQFRSASLAGNFTDKSNYHITIKFFGEVMPEQIRPITRALQKVASKISPFFIEPGRADMFRHPEGGLLYLDLSRGKKELWELADLAEEELEAAGFSREARPFKAHITLGRRVQLCDDFKFIAQDAGPVEFSSRASGIALMESLRERGKLVYRQLGFFPFCRK